MARNNNRGKLFDNFEILAPHIDLLILDYAGLGAFFVSADQAEFL